MKPKFGQNFLIDKNIANREVEYGEIKKNDIVLEIGPGKGILTELLAEKAKKVIAIEIDKNLFNRLDKKLPKNVELINADVLNIDFNNLPKFNKIVANLPFEISSPITFKLLDYSFEQAILIYQKEFAERMIALPGSKNYSRLTVNLYYKAFCEILEIVPKTSFFPQPKIDSCIVSIIPLKQPLFEIKNEKYFKDLVKKIFSYRRKKIKTILKNKKNLDNIPYLDQRIEELSPEQIAELSNILYERKYRI